MVSCSWPACPGANTFWAHALTTRDPPRRSRPGPQPPPQRPSGPQPIAENRGSTDQDCGAEQKQKCGTAPKWLHIRWLERAFQSPDYGLARAASRGRKRTTTRCVRIADAGTRQSKTRRRTMLRICYECATDMLRGRAHGLRIFPAPYPICCGYAADMLRICYGNAPICSGYATDVRWVPAPRAHMLRICYGGRLPPSRI